MLLRFSLPQKLVSRLCVASSMALKKKGAEVKQTQKNAAERIEEQWKSGNTRAEVVCECISLEVQSNWSFEGLESAKGVLFVAELGPTVQVYFADKNTAKLELIKMKLVAGEAGFLELESKLKNGSYMEETIILPDVLDVEVASAIRCLIGRQEHGS